MFAWLRVLIVGKRDEAHAATIQELAVETERLGNAVNELSHEMDVAKVARQDSSAAFKDMLDDVTETLRKTGGKP